MQDIHIVHNKKEISTFELTLFIFTMVFFVRIKGVDVRAIVSLVWIIRALMNVRKEISFKRNSIIYFSLIFIILIYSALVLLINQSTYWFMLLRYIRALISLLTITVYFYAFNIKPRKLIDSMLTCLLIHSTIIIVEMIIPNLETYVSGISGYSIRQIDYRASGLVSGYDFAGIIANIGFVISTVSIIITKQKKYIWRSCVFAISVFMTSRINVIVLVGILVILVFIARKHKRKGITVGLTVILSIVAIAALIFMVLSMNILPSLRENILNNIPIVRQLYSKMVNNYADYNLTGIIAQQVQFPIGIQFILGLASTADVDPGFIQTIYANGYIGAIINLGFYLYLFNQNKKRIKKTAIIYEPYDYKWVCLYSTAIILTIIMLMDIKLSFFFSAGTFEITMIFVVFNDNVYNRN